MVPGGPGVGELTVEFSIHIAQFGEIRIQDSNGGATF